MAWRLIYRLYTTTTNYIFICIRKYFIDNDALELVELEESLCKLDVQIAELEETNEVLFNQNEFNKQRFEHLSQRINKLISESKTKYRSCEQQSNTLKKGLNDMMTKDQ
jgi:hypothetical protein